MIDYQLRENLIRFLRDLPLSQPDSMTSELSVAISLVAERVKSLEKEVEYLLNEVERLTDGT